MWCKTTYRFLLALLLTVAVPGQLPAQTTVNMVPGSSVKLQSSAQGATGFQWMKDDVPIPGASQSAYVATAPGKYTVVTYSSGGCASEPADPVVIKVVSQKTADLSIAMKTDSRAVAVGEIFAYYLKVANNGPDEANGVVVSSVLPDGLSFEQLIQPQMGISHYDPVTKAITWEIASIAPGQFADLTFKVKAAVSGEVGNSAAVSAPVNDPVTGNNRAQEVKAIISLRIPNVFTPNGDGKNDFFMVSGLEFFHENQLYVFNRWGSSVYEQTNYRNDWAANGLSEGTYFYVLKVKSSSGQWLAFKGYVTVIR